MDVLKSEKMWDKKAQSYPRYSPEADTFEAQIIEMIEKSGVPLEGSTVLDIGCGSGKFSIGLAKKAGSLHGIDISGEMIRILKEDAEKEDVSNITAEKTVWDDFAGRAGRYDVIFCSTTPAVRSEKDYQTVHDMAEKAVVYLGWAGLKESDVSAAACRFFGVESKGFNDTPPLREWLDSKAIAYTAQVIENEFDRVQTQEDAAELIKSTVMQQGITPEDEEIKKILESFVKDGKITDRHYFRRELIIWEK